MLSEVTLGQIQDPSAYNSSLSYTFNQQQNIHSRSSMANDVSRLRALLTQSLRAPEPQRSAAEKELQQLQRCAITAPFLAAVLEMCVALQTPTIRRAISSSWLPKIQTCVFLLFCGSNTI